jgi:hypothetical protein
MVVMRRMALVTASYDLVTLSLSKGWQRANYDLVTLSLSKGGKEQATILSP